MMKELGVFPHNMSASSPNIDGDLVYVVTGNGVDESHIVIPAPDAPSFIAVNKMTGEVVWDKVGPGDKILHGQWSSPAIGVIGGVKQVVFPGGDGRLYAYEPETGKELWNFQCNPEGTVWKLGGRGTRNKLIATPVIYNDRVYIAMGQDPEHGEGPGHMYAVDATQARRHHQDRRRLAQRRSEPRPGHRVDLRQHSLSLRSLRQLPRDRPRDRQGPLEARHGLGRLELAVLCRRQGA